MPLNLYNEVIRVEEIVSDFGTSSISLPKNKTSFSPFLFPLSGSLSKSGHISEEEFCDKQQGLVFRRPCFPQQSHWAWGILTRSCFLSPCYPHPHEHSDDTETGYLCSSHPYTMVTISHGRSPNYDVPRYTQQFVLCATPWRPVSSSRRSTGAQQADTRAEQEGVRKSPAFTGSLFNFTYDSGPEPELSSDCQLLSPGKRAKAPTTTTPHI